MLLYDDDMAGFIDSRGSKTYRVLYTTSDDYEYWLTLSSIGLVDDPPPMVVWDDGEFISAQGVLHSSLDSMANHYGCVISEFTSTETVH